MRTCPALIALAVFCGSSSAQVLNRNQYHRWDKTTDFTSRGANGSSPGFVGQAFKPGFVGGLRRVTWIQYTVQDQDTSTQEPWHVGYAGVDAAGQPDWANLKTYLTNLTMPISTGIRAMTFTHTLATPVQVPASCEAWIHSWQFTKQTNWTTDGLGVHMSFQTRTPNNSPSLLCQTSPYLSKRESPRGMTTPNEVNERMGWSASSGSTNQPQTMSRAWKLIQAFDELVLSGAQDNTTYNNSPCPNPNEGYAGLDPEFADEAGGTPSRYDDFSWIFRTGTSYGGGFGVVLSSLTVQPVAGGVPTPFGPLYLDLLDPLFAFGPLGAVRLDAAGGGTVSMKLGPGTSPLRPIVGQLPTWSAQGVVLDSNGGNPRLTNVHTFRAATAPTGFTAAKVAKGGEVKVPRSAGETLYLRNDGYGTVTVQFKVRGVNVGPSADVCEFAAVRYRPASPAPGDFHITANKTNPTEILYRKNY